MALLIENWWQSLIIISVLIAGAVILSKSTLPILKSLNKLLKTLGREFLFKTKAARAGTINVIMVFLAAILIIFCAFPSVLSQLGLENENNLGVIITAFAVFIIVCCISAIFICQYEKVLTMYKDNQSDE